MHLPPAVVYPVGKSRWYLRLIVLASGMSFAVAAAFSVLQGAMLVPLLIALSAGATGALAWRHWQGFAGGTLQWDGSRWLWSGFTGDLPVAVTMHADFQSLLLVRVSAGIQREWLWLEAPRRAPVAGQWQALRRAVVFGHATDRAPDTPAG